MRSFVFMGCWSLGLLFGQGCDSSSGNPSPSPQECSDACARVAAANCGDIGQECFDACVNQGADHGVDDCRNQGAAYEICFFAASFYTCDAAGKTQPVGCDDERLALLACVDGSAAGGAGGEANGGGLPNAGAGGEASAGGG